MIVPSIKGAATLNMGLFALIAPLLYQKLPGFQPVSHGTLSIEIARIGSNDQPIITYYPLYWTEAILSGFDR